MSSSSSGSSSVFTSTLESLRIIGEDWERYQRAIVDELKDKPKTMREKLIHKHRVAQLLDMCSSKADDFLSSMDSSKDALQSEVEALSNENPNKVLSMFYTDFADLREQYKKRPPVMVSDPDEDVSHLRSQELVSFTGEERFGKHIDLIASHQTFINLPGMPKLSYATYLQTLSDFFDIPVNHKNATYFQYLTELFEYLRDFHHRACPLEPIEDKLETCRQDLLQQWESQEVLGYHRRPGLGQSTDTLSYPSGSVVDLDEISSAAELASLGMDVLKNELQLRGLKCGGTLEERALRLFSVRGLTISDVDVTLLAGNKKKKNKGSEKNEKGLTDSHRQIALLEAQISTLIGHLRSQVDATVHHIERKQVQTAAELEAEFEDEDEEDEVIESDNDDEVDEQDEDFIYNPKKLPLDATGRPIPYWLYKLHGLNVKYVCEICGNETYYGPRNFEKHFQEPKHQYGMRCLGIPNTRHFHGVTKIQDAIELWKNMKKNISSEQFNPEEEEEFEDAAGNAMTKKTYILMKKQGLIR